jgi:hypothetical protein
MRFSTALFAASITVVATLPLPVVASSYVEAFGGALVTDRILDTGRGRLIDHGGDGEFGGFRLGYGWSRPPSLYLGVEGDAWVASGRSRVNTNGMFDNLAFLRGAGIYGRLGWTPAESVLFYTRVGAQLWNFEETTATMPRRQTYRIAPAIGVGAEVPFRPGVYVRIDATYAYNPDLGLQLFQGTLGLGWRF